jgi:hypothetical protein
MATRSGRINFNERKHSRIDVRAIVLCIIVALVLIQTGAIKP